MRHARPVLVAAALLVALLGSHALVSSQPQPFPPRPGDRPTGGAPGAGVPFPVEGRVPDTLNQVRPQVLADGTGRVYRLWMDEWAGIGRNVRFQRSPDGGATWPPEPVMLDRDKPKLARSTAPAVVQDASGRLMVIWRSKLGGKKDMRFLASPDGGATWPGPAVAVSRGGGALSGEVAADGKGHVYVAWYDERRDPTERGGGREAREFNIFFNRSEDFGKTWLADDIRLSGPGSGRAEPRPGAAAAPKAKDQEDADEAEADKARPDKGDRKARRGIMSYHPRIATDAQGRVFLLFADTREGTAQLYFRLSEDHGKTWGPEVNVSGAARDAGQHQLLTDGQGRLYVVWNDRRHGQLLDVFFTRSLDAGKHWDEPVRLSRHAPGVTMSTTPHMALGPESRVYVTWMDKRNGRDDIYLNASADGGKTWLADDVRVDRDDAGTGISRNPHVVTYGARGVAVLWEDDRTGFEQILLNRSADGGKTWLERETRVDATAQPSGRALNPRAALDRAGTLHVVWEVAGGWGQQVERRVAYGRLPLAP